MTALGVFSVNTMSSVRAFVNGESLWSKGEKDALIYLERYAQSHHPDDYQRFLDALAVPLGDRMARTALERPHPDLAVARRGLLQGGNHPDDVDGMISLYLWFRQVDTFAEAVRIWTQADVNIDELRVLGENIRLQVQTGELGKAKLASLVADLKPLNDRLTAQGREFSATFGESSRDARDVVLTITLALAAALAVAGGLLIHHLMRRQQGAEVALRASNERWGLAAGAASIGVFDWDVALDRVTLDARAATMYGLPACDVDVQAGQMTRGVVHPEDMPALQRALRHAVDVIQPLVVRFRVVHPESGLRHVELNAHVREQGGSPRMVGILRDVSEDFVAQQLRLEKEAAERANRAKGAFLSRVSHELRTPLNAVLGFSQLMQLDNAGNLSAVQAERVQLIIDSSRQLLALINDMLDVTTLDEANLNLSVRAVDMVPLLDSSRRQVELLAQTHGVQLQFESPGAAIAVHADPRRLQQVFTNLLSNAIKYNRPMGVVRLVCRAEGDRVVVAVYDTGPGLSADQLAQLFQPLNRLGAEYSKVAGSGLGLVVTQQLLKLMGGTIDVSSEVGVGSRFVVTLPLLRLGELEVA